jgi:hypothetical protein
MLFGRANAYGATMLFGRAKGAIRCKIFSGAINIKIFIKNELNYKNYPQNEQRRTFHEEVCKPSDKQRRAFSYFSLVHVRE